MVDSENDGTVPHAEGNKKNTKEAQFCAIFGKSQFQFSTRLMQPAANTLTGHHSVNQLLLGMRVPMSSLLFENGANVCNGTDVFATSR